MAQTEHKIVVKTATDDFELHGRPCELSAFSFVAPNRHLPKERTYFNVDKQERYSHSTFDRQFMKDFGFNPKLPRDDREHFKSKGLDVNKEERSKNVTALSSSIYGQRIAEAYDGPLRQYNHVNIVQTDFYRRNGTNLDEESGVKMLRH